MASNAATKASSTRTRATGSKAGATKSTAKKKTAARKIAAKSAAGGTTATPKKAAKKTAARKTGTRVTAKAKTGAGKATAGKSAPGKTSAAKASGRKSAPRKKASAKKRQSAGTAPVRPGRPAARTLEERAVEQPLMTTLRAEHRQMARVMKLFSEQLRTIEAGEIVDTHVVYEIMDYMVNWPDRYHHPREDVVYAKVAELSDEAAESVANLQREHDEMVRSGRAVLTRIEGWRAGTISGQALIESGRDYIERSYAHMNREENEVFPRIEDLLSAEDWLELARENRLRPVSDPVFGPRVQRDFRNLARKLRRTMRRGVERGTMVEWISIEAFLESLEVLSMANDAARSVTSDHLRGAWYDGVDMFRTSPLTAPVQVAINNTRQTFRWLSEVAEISRDTLGDLARVNRERQNRIRLLDRA